MDRRRCLRPVGHTRGMDNTGACPDTFGEDLARVDRETADLLTTVATMTVGDLAEPARCVGWTRAHVIGHLARNADSLVNLATWAITGVPTPQYPSAEQRAADIQRSAAQSLAELQADLTASAQRCREALAALAGELTSPLVTLRSGVLGVRIADPAGQRVGHPPLRPTGQVEPAGRFPSVAARRPAAFDRLAGPASRCSLHGAARRRGRGIRPARRARVRTTGGHGAGVSGRAGGLAYPGRQCPCAGRYLAPGTAGLGLIGAPWAGPAPHHFEIQRSRTTSRRNPS